MCVCACCACVVVDYTTAALSFSILFTHVRGSSLPSPSNVTVYGGNSQGLVFFTSHCDDSCFTNDGQCFSNFSMIPSFSDDALSADATYFVADDFLDLYEGVSYESPVEVFGLDNGVSYNFSVLARNSTQFGDPSGDSESIVAGMIPSKILKQSSIFFVEALHDVFWMRQDMFEMLGLEMASRTASRCVRNSAQPQDYQPIFACRVLNKLTRISQFCASLVFSLQIRTLPSSYQGNAH